MYVYEEEIKNSISIKTQLMFTAMFALLSVAAYLARFLDFTERPTMAFIIALLVFSVIAIAAVSVYFNCRAFSGSEFNRMPYASEVKNTMTISWPIITILLNTTFKLGLRIS